MNPVIAENSWKFQFIFPESRTEFGNITAFPIKLTVLHYCSEKFWNLSIKLRSDESHNAEILMYVTLTIYPNVSVCSFLIR